MRGQLTVTPESAKSESSTSLVHEGWDHLRSQRPLAAWASWQRALRVDPDSTVAAQALSTLESATDLPLAARTPYRFRQPRDPARRAAWDDRMRGGNLEDLDAAAAAFDRLTILDPDDAAAWYNKALCLAWAGENVVSIACLDRVVTLEARRRLTTRSRPGPSRKSFGREEGPRRWLTTCGSPARSPGMPRDTPRHFFMSFPRSASFPRPAHRGSRPSSIRRSRCSNGSIVRSGRLIPFRSDGSQAAMVLASVFITGEFASPLEPSRRESRDGSKISFSRGWTHAPQSIRREATPLPLPVSGRRSLDSFGFRPASIRAGRTS